MSELANAATGDAVETATPAVPHWHRLLPWVGLALAVVVWWIGAQLLILRTPIAASFAPWPALQALARLLASGELWPHVVTSMQRVAVGLGLAVAIGVPLGVLTGLSRRFAKGTTPLFQFLDKQFYFFGRNGIGAMTCHNKDAPTRRDSTSNKD